MDTPKVSIIIPAYNASNYLAKAIDSALSQTYSNVEVIVVNDGSKDNGMTEQIALSYGDRIRYFYKENGGSSSALNTGIANMTGEWFSWLSHDDLYSPNKINEQIQYMESLKLNGDEKYKHVFFTASELIDARGNKIRAFREKKEKILATDVASVSHNSYFISQPTKYNFHGCSCLIHRKVFNDVGVFDENLRLINDIDMWFRIYAANYKIHYIPIPLVYGRAHSGQISKSIGFSHHNDEQDMFWNRSLNWLLHNCSDEENLLFQFGKNAYLKTRDNEADRAFSYISSSKSMKYLIKLICRFRARIRNLGKKIYLKVKV